MKIKIINIFVWSSIIVLFLTLSYLVLSTSGYIRFWADDFCTTTGLINNGFWQTQVSTWSGWSGRYSATFFISLAETLGLSMFKFLPVLLFSFFLVPLLMIFGIVAGIPLSIIVILNSPNIIQTFYWATGSLNYLIPFVFLNLYLINIYKNKSKYTNIISFILMFIASGFSESFAIATLFFFVFVFVSINLLNTNLAKLFNKKLIAGFVATLISLVVMYLSPGNAVRSSLVSHPESFFNWFYDTGIYTKWFLISRFNTEYFTVSLLTLFLSPLFFNIKTKIKLNNQKLILLLSLLFIPLITFVVTGVTYYALNWEPPERVMFIATTYIFYSFFIFSFIYWNSQNLKEKNLKFFKILFVINILFLTYYTNKYLNINKLEIKEYAIQWDRVEQLMIASKASDEVVIPNIKPVGKLDGFVENKGWVLSCIAGYYGLEKIELFK